MQRSADLVVGGLFLQNDSIASCSFLIQVDKRIQVPIQASNPRQVGFKQFHGRDSLLPNLFCHRNRR
jgi:hypothetical protein